MSVTAVTVDDEEPQLLTQEIATERTATIEHALALIADRVRATMLSPAAAGPEEAVAPTFRNHYRCERCGHEWTDDWSAMCDDDCPNCGARHMSPHKSEDLPSPEGSAP